MVDKYKGVVEVEVAGGLLGFKFGLRAMSLFAESIGVSFTESSQVLTDAEQSFNIEIIMKFWHAATVAYSRLKGDKDRSLDEVYALVEEIGLDVLFHKIAEAHKLPNESAPMPGQS